MKHMEPRLSSVDWITPERPRELQALLSDARLIERNDEVTSVSLAGEGNMNCTLRVRTFGQSFIVKQSRPWVEKYPNIPAPVDRALHEMQFYETVANHPLVSKMMPRLLASDPQRYLMILEDLGESKDATFLYDDIHSNDIAPRLIQLAEWLAALHNITIDEDKRSQFRNRALRELNHAHIFQVPFYDPPAIDLEAITPGLARIVAELNDRPGLVARASDLGEKYLQPGPCLLHGDFFPGSWLLDDQGVKVIDPEFCFLGRPEFDLAVCTAHLRMAGMPQASSDTLSTIYHQKRNDDLPWDEDLVSAWAGMEIIRRLLGVAQLPLKQTIEEKQALLDWAVSAMTAAI